MTFSETGPVFVMILMIPKPHIIHQYLCATWSTFFNRFKDSFFYNAIARISRTTSSLREGWLLLIMGGNSWDLPFFLCSWGTISNAFSIFIVPWKGLLLKVVCTSLARRDHTTQRGHWQVAISSTQLSINIIRKRGSWGPTGTDLGSFLYRGSK